MKEAYPHTDVRGGRRVTSGNAPVPLQQLGAGSTFVAKYRTFVPKATADLVLRSCEGDLPVRRVQGVSPTQFCPQILAPPLCYASAYEAELLTPLYILRSRCIMTFASDVMTFASTIHQNLACRLAGGYSRGKHLRV